MKAMIVVMIAADQRDITINMKIIDKVYKVIDQEITELKKIQDIHCDGRNILGRWDIDEDIKRLKDIKRKIKKGVK